MERNAGGMILKNRVLGTLAVTRTLGDLEMKAGVLLFFFFKLLQKKGVSNDPFVNKITLDKFDKFVVIASDGLWDVIDDQVNNLLTFRKYVIRKQLIW